MDDGGHRSVRSAVGPGNGDDRDRKWLSRTGSLWWCCLAFLGGPIVFVTGLWMLFSISDTRLARVAEYTDAVRRWETVRHSFAGLDVCVLSLSEDEPFLGILPATDGGAPSPLDPLLAPSAPARPLFTTWPQRPAGEVAPGFHYLLNFTSDPLHKIEEDHFLLDRDRDKLEDYKPLFYVSDHTHPPVGSFGYLITITDGNSTQAVRINHVPPISTRTVILSDCLKRQCDPDSRDARCRKLTSCEQECVTRGGNYKGGDLCQFYVRLQTVCVVIARNDKDQWAVIINREQNASSRQMGCYFESKGSVHGVPRFSPATYAEHKVGSVRVELRHADDPHIAASRLTLGTYEFGPSWWEKFALALLVTAVGALWTTCVAATTCVAGKRLFGSCGRRSEQRDNEYQRILDNSEDSRIVPSACLGYGSMDGRPYSLCPGQAFSTLSSDYEPLQRSNQPEQRVPYQHQIPYHPYTYCFADRCVPRKSLWHGDEETNGELLRQI